MQRKTKAITLTMLAGGAVLLTGCREDEKPQMVADDRECAEKMGDADGCRDALRQAQQAHEKTAPRFSSQQECEAQFGPDKCRRTETDGGSVFLPAMAGFFIGRMMSGGTPAYQVQSACSNGREIYSNGCGPVRQGGTVQSSGSYAGHRAGAAFQPAPAFANAWTSNKVAASRVAPGPAAISRGGFGRSAVMSAGS